MYFIKATPHNSRRSPCNPHFSLFHLRESCGVALKLYNTAYSGLPADRVFENTGYWLLKSQANKANINGIDHNHVSQFIFCHIFRRFSRGVTGMEQLFYKKMNGLRNVYVHILARSHNCTEYYYHLRSMVQ